MSQEIIFIIRLLIALICGGAIGFEREHKHKGAGIRTYMSVCITSCLVMILAQYLIQDYNVGDISRLPSASITGFGFLGAGLIFNSKGKIINLTTASTLWGTVALGFVIGYGLYLLSIVFTILILLVNVLIYNLFEFEKETKGDIIECLKKKFKKN